MGFRHFPSLTVYNRLDNMIGEEVSLAERKVHVR